MKLIFCTIEDNSIIHEILKIFSEKVHTVLFHFEDGGHFAELVLDIMLPKGDGDEVLRIVTMLRCRLWLARGEKRFLASTC